MILKRHAINTAAALVALVALTDGCERGKSWIDHRKDAFTSIAAQINGPILDLQPYHTRILPREAGGVMFVDVQLGACVEAAPLVDKLASVDVPPDGETKALESAREMRTAAQAFGTGLKGCRPAERAQEPAEAGAPPSEGGQAGESVSQCRLRCMQGWSTLVRSAERVRRDADWLGVHVESIASIKKPE
jgi:hypothetical protein